uniref:Receptor ligand binding region domain-containing protein n=1 Tax=Trichogramma kaykai TaxID=54128 RepID=A0ABD2X7Y4_9HYME
MIQFLENNTRNIITMQHFSWLLLSLSLCFYTCQAEKNCHDVIGISVIKNFNDESCQLHKGVSPNSLSNFSLARYSFMINNKKSSIILYDSCGDNDRTLKAVFDTLEWVNINCLSIPHFLGFIGPDEPEEIETALKVTSALKLPHISSLSAPKSSTYSHFLPQEKKNLIPQALLKLIDTLRWKAITIKKNTRNDNIMKIADNFIRASLKNKICLTSEQTSHIIYFGEWNEEFFNSVNNAFIIVITSENISNEKLQSSNLKNTFLIVDNIGKLYSGSEMNQLEKKLQSVIKNLENLNEVLDALNIYITSLQSICQKSNCHVNYDEWNQLIDETIKSKISSTDANIYFKVIDKRNELQNVGEMRIHDEKIELFWKKNLLTDLTINSQWPLTQFVMENDSIDSCDGKLFDIENSMNKAVETYFTTEISNSEWWKMIGTVTGIGVAMFAFGFCAVYIIYSNIRGPKEATVRKPERNYSLKGITRHRAGSHMNNEPNLRRNESRSSIKSSISDKSV